MHNIACAIVFAVLVWDVNQTKKAPNAKPDPLYAITMLLMMLVCFVGAVVK
jgi:hypothetical protein